VRSPLRSLLDAPTRPSRTHPAHAQESKCCSEFEFCVSCCQGSAAVTSGAWKTANVIGGRSETGVVADAFDFCRGKCRTNPKSTVRHAAAGGAAPASRCC
jgi:hypothetical protein